MSDTAFMSVVVINKMEKRGGGTEIPMVSQRIINISEIVDISEGRALHDGGMGRDFETCFIVLKDGTEYEVDSTIPLMEKSLFEVGSFIKVDPLANEEVDEEQTAKVGKSDDDTSEGFESLHTTKEDENGGGEGGTATAQIPRTETRRRGSRAH